jgi:hypothetical protein
VCDGRDWQFAHKVRGVLWNHFAYVPKPLSASEAVGSSPMSSTILLNNFRITFLIFRSVCDVVCDVSSFRVGGNDSSRI